VFTVPHEGTVICNPRELDAIEIESFCLGCQNEFKTSIFCFCSSSEFSLERCFWAFCGDQQFKAIEWFQGGCARSFGSFLGAALMARLVQGF
jgi:hypothetical protein